MENIDEVKGLQGKNKEQCTTVDSFAAFYTHEEPFFAIGKVVAKGVANEIKFDLDGYILRIVDRFL